MTGKVLSTYQCCVSLYIYKFSEKIITRGKIKTYNEYVNQTGTKISRKERKKERAIKRRKQHTCRPGRSSDTYPLRSLSPRAPVLCQTTHAYTHTQREREHLVRGGTRPRHVSELLLLLLMGEVNGEKESCTRV